jgi:hypothetical protein
MDDVQLRDESFQRPPGFNLAAAWQSWRAHVAEGQVSYVVKVRVSPDFAPTLPSFFGRGIRAKIAQAGPPDDNGWITLDLAFESFYDARGRILGFGRGVEVVEPLPLRQSIIDFASQTLALYGQRLVSAA